METRLKSILEEKNISMYRLAKEADLPYATVNYLCSGKSDPAQSRYHVLKSVADALNMTIEDVFFKSEDD